MIFMKRNTPEKLIRRYKTKNPIDLAKSMGILVIFEPLGEINGYFNTAFRQKIIHINSTLPQHKQLFTAAHELGHAVLHPHANTPFLREKTLFSVNKLEMEANKFAVDFLISDADIKEVAHLPVNKMAAYFGIHKKLMELRLSTYSV